MTPPTGKNNPKRDWIDVVDGALDRADRVLDRFRKTPRRRLVQVPTPPVPVDPFGAPALAKEGEKPTPPADPDAKPLGDPGLPRADLRQADLRRQRPSGAVPA